MNCTVTPLSSLDEDDSSFIYTHATRSGSEFQSKLSRGGLTVCDGTIAVVRDFGEIVGWARTEVWTHDAGASYDTLEAFTRVPWRRRGVCRYAVAGLIASRVFTLGFAVFSPRMTDLCRHLGVEAIEFCRERDKWVRAR